jgi:DNA helicase II / ATP-dependent DNA helicase PcrA
LTNTLCIAGAGSGKTHKIITESIAKIKSGGKVLVVTYTTSNQQELRNRFLAAFGRSSDRFVVKGLFSFYLEDLVRPYQQVFFPKRIDGIFFNERNPHLKPGSTAMLLGRKEQLNNKQFNSDHFLTKCHTKAHTGFLAKLAVRIMKATNNSAAVRLGDIYCQVYFDEVQDLVGWDYEVLKSLSKYMKRPITCVGDFRQTVYETSFGHKSPQVAADKIKEFNSMGFEEEVLAFNRRCIQQICEVADTVHAGTYGATKSAVDLTPEEFRSHLGVFIVKQSDLDDYITAYDPMVLRSNISSGKKILPANARCYNFGKSKGLSFDRVLVLPADSQMHFVLDGRIPFLEEAETAQNKLYVAITRARYSVGFLVPDNKAHGLRFPVWGR